MQPKMSTSHYPSPTYLHPTYHIALLPAMTSTSVSHIPSPTTLASHIRHTTPSTSHTPHPTSHVPHLLYICMTHCTSTCHDIYIPHPTSQNVRDPNSNIPEHWSHSRKTCRRNKTPKKKIQCLLGTPRCVSTMFNDKKKKKNRKKHEKRNTSPLAHLGGDGLILTLFAHPCHNTHSLHKKH